MDIVDARVWVKGIPQFEEDIRACSNAVIYMYGAKVEDYERVRDNLQTMVDYMSERLDDHKKKTLGE